MRTKVFDTASYRQACEHCKHGIVDRWECDVSGIHALEMDMEGGRVKLTCRDFEEGENHD